MRSYARVELRAVGAPPRGRPRSDRDGRTRRLRAQCGRDNRAPRAMSAPPNPRPLRIVPPTRWASAIPIGENPAETDRAGSVASRVRRLRSLIRLAAETKHNAALTQARAEFGLSVSARSIAAAAMSCSPAKIDQRECGHPQGVRIVFPRLQRLPCQSHGLAASASETGLRPCESWWTRDQPIVALAGA